MPAKPHPTKYTPRTALLPQTTPDQLDIAPVQALLVACAPLQLQPDMLVQVPGQFVMPCLKAHKALASDCCWLDVGAIDGEKVGSKDHEGDIEGDTDGSREGGKVGNVEMDGETEGDAVGKYVGIAQTGVDAS